MSISAPQTPDLAPCALEHPSQCAEAIDDDAERSPATPLASGAKLYGSNPQVIGASTLPSAFAFSSEMAAA